MRKSLIAVLLGLFSAVILGGCNTIEGLGKDVKKGGEKIEKAAERAKS
ncbi:MAG: entericidin A/B family lipoprotein [Betaproteobacteria bacterium]